MSKITPFKQIETDVIVNANNPYAAQDAFGQGSLFGNQTMSSDTSLLDQDSFGGDNFIDISNINYNNQPDIGLGNISGLIMGAGMNPGSLLLGGVGIAQSIFAGIKARKDARRARRQLSKENKKLKELENTYKNLDTSNPYLNMENTMEDLTVNQQQADFQRQSFQQSQANIMDSLRGAAGGSGIASLAQSLAQQGQIAAQQQSASIGQQEAANQMAQAQMAGQIQGMERQGDVLSRQMKEQQTSKLMSIQQQRAMMREQQLMQAQQAQAAATQAGIGAFGNVMQGVMGISQPDKKSNSLLELLQDQLK
mgnify:FL=1